MRRQSNILNINILNILLPLALAGCSWDRFDDLANEAPALMIEQEGDISSASFGDHMAGLGRTNNVAGGALFLSGNAETVLGTALLSPNGDANYSQTNKDKLKDLGSPNRINAVSAVPPGLTVANVNGPFAYVGSAAEGTFALDVIDIGRYISQKTIKPGGNWPETVEGFGLAVTAAEFGKDSHLEDIAVGAQDMVVLLKAKAWPSFDLDNPIIVSAKSTASTEWPKGDFTKIVSADLVNNADGSVNHEVVAAVPAENSVAVIYDVNSECFADDKIPEDQCAKIVRLDENNVLGFKVPLGFGSALLLANVDQDPELELLVGADESNKIFVFNFEMIETGVAPTVTRTLKVTLDTAKTIDEAKAPGSKGLGTSLAFGPVLSGTEPKLAAGAPGTEVDGVANAGRIYFFSKDLQWLGGTQDEEQPGSVSFVSPEDNTLLGLSLARIPFRSSDNGPPAYLLAAGGRDAVFVFFGNIAGEPVDVRVK